MPTKTKKTPAKPAVKKPVIVAPSPPPEPIPAPPAETPVQLAPPGMPTAPPEPTIPHLEQLCVDLLQKALQASIVTVKIYLEQELKKVTKDVLANARKASANMPQAPGEARPDLKALHEDSCKLRAGRNLSVDGGSVRPV